MRVDENWQARVCVRVFCVAWLHASWWELIGIIGQTSENSHEIWTSSKLTRVGEVKRQTLVAILINFISSTLLNSDVFPRTLGCVNVSFDERSHSLRVANTRYLKIKMFHSLYSGPTRENAKAPSTATRRAQLNVQHVQQQTPEKKTQWKHTKPGISESENEEGTRPQP